MNRLSNPSNPGVLWGLALLFALAVAVRLGALHVGSPFITIDDKTAFEGGFLVWFGQAPPQRMYLESWLYGLVCICTYIVRLLTHAANGGFDVSLVAHAYRDFYTNPEPYTVAYRLFTLVLDLATTFVVYLIAKRALADRWRGWAAFCVAAMYLLTYNTLWSGLVARPDSVVAFFASVGVLLYLKSNQGRDRAFLAYSAVALGCAAGMKLHGAFASIFVCIDLLRVHGFFAGLRKAVRVALISGFIFCVTAGSPLFDPLMYLKLRAANYTDDHSPWLLWGNQFLVMLKGSGWVALPAALLGIWFLLTRRDRPATKADQDVRSIMVFGVGWLVLFALIRQLRAYWMLPALPVFYVLAMYGITAIPRRALAIASAAVVLVALGVQLLMQFHELKSARYDELREWATANTRGKPFYIVGYDALILPKNTECIGNTARVLEQGLVEDAASGIPFTLRHVKSWEERSTLMLFDMLERQNEPGYEFYDSYSTPPAALEKVVSLDRFQFLVVQEGFALHLVPEVKARLADYHPVAEKYGAGGEALGLKYTIYQRR